MPNSLFQFNFQDYQQEKENSYPISDVQWIYINDINQSNYSNGFINFTNISVIVAMYKTIFMVSRIFSYPLYNYCCTS